MPRAADDTEVAAAFWMISAGYHGSMLFRRELRAAPAACQKPKGRITFA